MIATTTAEHAFHAPAHAPRFGRTAPSPLPLWLARTIEGVGWMIYLGALSVLGSFAFILCAAVMRG